MIIQIKTIIMIMQMVALNSKHRTNRKQRKHRKMTQTNFPKEYVEKAALGSPLIEQNSDHMRLTQKIQFCSSFNF